MARRIGPLTVHVTAADVTSFAEAVAPGGADVPMVFPLRWLALPEIAAAVTALAEPGRNAVLHESQRFDTERPLRANEALALTVDVQSQPPSRLVLTAVARDAGGGDVARFSTILRLLPLQGAA